jgi:hypothetical protein
MEVGKSRKKSCIVIMISVAKKSGIKIPVTELTHHLSRLASLIVLACSSPATGKLQISSIRRLVHVMPISNKTTDSIVECKCFTCIPCLLYRSQRIRII